MTLKEFSEKYDVPYYLVYEASYRVRPISSMIRDRDFDEECLFRETVKLIERRIMKYEKMMKQNIEAQKKLYVKSGLVGKGG